MPTLKSDDFWKPVVTTRQILRGEDAILCVHLDQEGDWEALGSDDFSDDDLDVCSIEELLSLDPTLCLLPELQPGQVATRNELGAPWEV